jgi:cysteine synthase B
MSTVLEDKILTKRSTTSFYRSGYHAKVRIGNTPLIELSKISEEFYPVKIFAKAEWYNQGGSVKDRAALNMIQEGIKSGKLTENKTILDATSGNTGIAYAMLGAVFGYKVKLVIPENAGPVFKHILKAYGAELIFSNAQNGSDGAIREAKQIHNENPEIYFFPDQYNNSANWQSHYNNTGPEIIKQSRAKITHFIAGLGTSGTFVGTSRRLKKFNPDIQVISFQPDSPLHGLEGLKHMETAIVPGIYDSELADSNLEINTEEAQDMLKKLARDEGLFVGISSGAASVAAVKVAKSISEGHIVVIFPDSGHKYFDQNFWGEN